jgi:hypothetical protein
MMKICQWTDINSLAVRQVGKPAVYVSNGLDYCDEPQDEKIWDFVAAEMADIYGIATNEYYGVMAGLVSGGMFFFDSEKEQNRFYRVFEQPLTDSSAIYSCTYSADGVCKTENT